MSVSLKGIFSLRHVYGSRAPDWARNLLVAGYAVARVEVKPDVAKLQGDEFCDQADGREGDHPMMNRSLLSWSRSRRQCNRYRSADGQPTSRERQRVQAQNALKPWIGGGRRCAVGWRCWMAAQMAVMIEQGAGPAGRPDRAISR